MATETDAAIKEKYAAKLKAKADAQGVSVEQLLNMQKEKQKNSMENASQAAEDDLLKNQDTESLFVSTTLPNSNVCLLEFTFL